MWKQNYVWLSYYFNFERNYVVLKSMHFVEQKYKLKNKTESEMENPYSFKETNLVFQLI